MKRRKYLKDNKGGDTEQIPVRVGQDRSVRKSGVQRRHFQRNKQAADGMPDHVKEYYMHDTAAQTEKQSQGQELPESTRRKMETSFGEDLKGVKIHRDQAAAKSASVLQAKAYTRGNDVYFGKGQYSPESLKGLEILAHELTHVIQCSGKSQGGLRKFERTDSAIEREARDVSSRIMGGQKTSVRRNANSAGFLRTEEETKVAPTMTKHGQEISPVCKRGTINTGTFLLTFYYEASEKPGETILVLQIPDGVVTLFGAFGGMPSGGYHVNDRGGDKSRTVRISLIDESEEVPRIRAMFSQKNDSYIVIFQLALVK